jgi:multiple sugar transport system substrate-binding protein
MPPRPTDPTAASPWLVWVLAGWLLLLAAACQPEALLTPPRAVTQTAIAQSPPQVTPPPTPTLSSFAANPAATRQAASDLTEAPVNPSITLWVHETSPAHVARLEQMVTQFQEEHSIQVEVLHVIPDLLPELMDTAVLSDTMPDLVLHPIDYTMGWLAEGVLDPTPAQSLLNRLGAGTFDQAALGLLQSELPAGPIAGLPSDGYKQILAYRGDWFDAQGLAPPVNYTGIISGAAGIARPERLISGLVVPTEDALVSTQRVFEQFAIANGCQLIAANGEVTLLQPACFDALNFYRSLVNGYSPSDIQTDTSALNAYLEGRTGIVLGSPALLPVLAGLDPRNQPRCPECDEPGFLARQTRVVSAIRGRGTAATEAVYAQLSILGFTSKANVPAAAAFAEYWFEDGYLLWLSLDPAQKAPLRYGTPAEPGRYLSAWLMMPLIQGGPTLADLYGEDVVTDLASDLGQTNRWGLAEGQGAVVSALTQDRVFSVLLQEMLSGYQTTSRTLLDAYDRTVALIPGYAYDESAETVPPDQ